MYCDADHAGCNDTRRSTSGWQAFMNGGCIAHQVKVQDSTSGNGPCESEVKSTHLAATNGVWMGNLLNEWGYSNNKPTMIHVDNQGAIDYSHNSCKQSLMKHLETKYHSTRDFLSEKLIILVKIPTAENVSDILTKALSSVPFWYFLMKLVYIPEHLRPPADQLRKARKRSRDEY